jgi:hypothetical protein
LTTILLFRNQVASPSGLTAEEAEEVCVWAARALLAAS